jgi:methionyl-tRNA synthetase
VEGQEKTVAEAPRWYQTTAIDYPNSRPHIGTAFEKLGADVQARYRRQEGYEVFFLMGNDENTIKVAKKAAELGQDIAAYCDDMARQFREVWDALEISYDTFVQTSHERHKTCCRKFIQKVFDNGYIYKGTYEGLYCEGCESFKTEKDLENGLCPIHKTPVQRRSEPCHFFAQSKFQDRLLRFYEEYPDFIQPESRRNEVLAYVQGGLQDVNITRLGQTWGIQVPFDPEFTIWVWFDALLTYITGIGYGDDETAFRKWWPADIHFIGKDITRFHCALWPAMCFAAGIDPPRQIFGHGFVYFEGERMSKTMGNVVEPMYLIDNFNAEAFRYYFLRECPFPSDGNFSWKRFEDLYNADLANNLGNLFSRVVTIIGKNYGGHLVGDPAAEPGAIYTQTDLETTVKQVQDHVETCRYNLALQAIWQQVLDPTNRYMDRKEPWKLVKTDRDAARQVMLDLVEQLRSVSILLKPFLPKTAATIYGSFNFPQAWDTVCCEDAWSQARRATDLRVTAALVDGKVKALFPRIA